MLSSFNNLSVAGYGDLRWLTLVYLEESGNPKEAVYHDSVGIATIGVGFNLRVDFVRKAVLEGLGFSYADP